MKIVLQRVKQAKVQIGQKIAGRIGKGYLLLVGFDRNDTVDFLRPMLDKILKICLFPNETGRMVHSIADVSGSLLIVSQFTLSANVKKGKRPSFSRALEPEKAEKLYGRFLALAKQSALQVESGEFGAKMQVFLQNDGPVTLLLDSKDLFPSLNGHTRRCD